MAIEQKYEALFTELQRLRVDNAEAKEREKVTNRKKEEALEKIKALDEANRKLRDKKHQYKKDLMDVWQAFRKNISSIRE